MIHQEEAKDLFEKFYRITASQPFGEVEYFYHSIEYFEAKQCALICVDEKIETATVYSNDELLIEESERKIIELEEVKQEIENL